MPTSKAERAAFVLSDAEILTLARWACMIEAHYGCPMDMEWAKDGETGEMFIVQARPETVQSRREAGVFKAYEIKSKGKTLLTGLGIGDAVVAGRVCLIENVRDIDRFVDGAILVTKTTDPDWVPIMKRAAAIITDHGGRTSHAAIVSRELGLPAIVGTGNATAPAPRRAGGDGVVRRRRRGLRLRGHRRLHGADARRLASAEDQDQGDAQPRQSRRRRSAGGGFPADGVGLARMEFVVSNHIKVHPMALVRFDALKDEAAKREIAELTAGYADKTEYFVDRLARGLARIAAASIPSRSSCA